MYAYVASPEVSNSKVDIKYHPSSIIIFYYHFPSFLSNEMFMSCEIRMYTQLWETVPNSSHVLMLLYIYFLLATMAITSLLQQDNYPMCIS